MLYLDDINIAIASASEKIRQLLKENLQQRKALISCTGFLDASFIQQLEREESVDVVLLDISNDYDDDFMEVLLDKVEIPILFHDNKLLSELYLDKLAEKISALDAKSVDVSASSQSQEHATVSAINLWLLGASIGGPESVKRFLNNIPADLPVAFVLAQHLGEGFEELLAQQLDSGSKFNVKQAVNGDILKHGQVLVVPVSRKIIFNSNGAVSVLEEQWQGHYKPSINEVINNVIDYFKIPTGVIIFSGMGADGVEASLEYSRRCQGLIWAQNAGSCVVSSMPDSVRKADIVSYSGSPEELAKEMIAHHTLETAYKETVDTNERS